MLLCVSRNVPVTLPQPPCSSAALGGASQHLLCSLDTLQVWAMQGSAVTLAQAESADDISLPLPASCRGPRDQTAAGGTAWHSQVRPTFSMQSHQR